MQIGFIGLGRMGKNMVFRLLQGGHEVVAFNRSPEPVREVVAKGAVGAESIEDLCARLKGPRVVWIMVPAGEVTQKMIDEVAPHLHKGDLIIDGGNSFYKDAVRRSGELEAKGLRFMDVGTSGGVWGLKVGYCLMIGGGKTDFEQLEPVFKTLAPKDGYLHTGPAGAGHFVKMIHNGIEYGMLEAIGEGFEIMKASGYPLDFAKISHLWNQGSVVRSWLMELAEIAFGKDPDLESIRGYVGDSGEGRWTVTDALEKDVPAPVLTLALLARLRSRQDDSYTAKVIAALRNEFGAHPVKKA
ncbi:MAG: decarboxylating 6-phosphogluconate dehydrogenase [Candidatus Omnitrophica bacterium]|nr:decarboxylating 6-phosphogluconate dehydrogenase [Candidatus Omnitrophota bacterium]